MLKLTLQAFSNFKFRSLFFRILLLLLLLVIIPVLLIGLIGNWHSQAAVRKEVEQSSAQMLDQTRRLMDVLLNDLDSWSLQLAHSEALAELMESGSIDGTSDSFNELQDHLLDLYINSPYIQSVYVYYADRDLIQGPLIGAVPLRQFEDIGWLSHYQGMGKQEGKWVVRTSGQAASKNRKGAPTVTLIRKLPLLGDRVQGAIVVNLDQQALFQTPSLHLMREQEEIWMISPDGKYAFSNVTGSVVDPDEFSDLQRRIDSGEAAFVRTFRGKPYAFTTVMSPYTHWKYVNVLPVDVLYQRSRQVQSFMLLLAGLAVAIAVVLAFAAAAKIYSPLHTLMGLFHGRRKDEPAGAPRSNELDFLVAEIRRMDQHASVLQDQLREHIPVLQQSFLHQLLHERSSDPQGRMDDFAHYGMAAEPYGFFAIVLRIDDFERFAARYSASDQGLVRYFIAKLTEELMHHSALRAYYVFVDNRDIVMLGNLSSDGQAARYKELAEAVARQALEQVTQYIPWSVSAGLGSLRPDPGDICVSYEEANSALELRAYRGPGALIPIWSIHRERPESMLLMDRLAELRKELLLHLKDKDASLFERTLQALQQWAGTIERIPFPMIRHSFFQLLVDVYRRAADLGLPAEERFELSLMHECVARAETVLSLTETVAEYMSAIKQAYDVSKHQGASPAVRHILQYIEANFNKEISLGGIAEHLQLDPSYVSRLFKQQIHVNFMEYLISLRMAKAKELLAGSPLPIKEIGAAVGYANQRSFNRIFKKYEGTTPGEYRELHLPLKLDINRVY